MNVLFICTGNTCRSPMAEGYLDSLKLPNVTAKSRGLAANGEAVSLNAKAVMKEKDIDLEGWFSDPLTAADLAWADKILYMSPSHYTVLRLYAPDSKLLMLGSGISDPFGGDIEVYRQCRNEIFSAIDALVAEDFFTETQVYLADSADIKGIAELEKECFSTPWSENALADALAHNTTFFTAKKGERVLGYVGISCVLDEGYITNIAVTKSARKQGVASGLLERLFAFAKDNSLSFVTLEVRKSNESAISLYEKFGFCREGLRKGFYSLPKEDALIFTRHFS